MQDWKQQQFAATGRRHAKFEVQQVLSLPKEQSAWCRQSDFQRESLDKSVRSGNISRPGVALQLGRAGPVNTEVQLWLGSARIDKTMR